MAADTPGIWQILNGLAQKMFAPTTVDASGNITPQFAPRTNGAPVEISNSLPVQIVLQGSSSAVGQGNPMPVTFASAAVADESGSNQLVPSSPSANGTSLGALPSWAKGIRFYLGTSDALSFVVGYAQPTSAPAAAVSISGNLTTGTGPNWDEPLAPGQLVYVTAVSGSPKFRFVS